jgi:hypothetical protein
LLSDALVEPMNVSVKFEWDPDGSYRQGNSIHGK